MVLGAVLRRFNSNGSKNRAEKQGGANSLAEPPKSIGEDGSPLMFQTSGNAVKLEDDTVTMSEAERSLLRSRTLLMEALTKAACGNHDRHDTDLDIPALLDESAAALDEAALALKVAKLDNLMNRDNPDKKAKLKKDSQLVKTLADDLSEIRKKLLASMFENNEEEVFLQSSTGSNLGGGSGPLVLWATHTGTSQKYALDLAQRLNADAKNIKDVSLKDLSKRKGGSVYFVCSTFGAGRPPRDGEAFFAELQNCKGTPLKGVDVAVAALGNSAFDHFTLFGMALSMELARAGAREIMEMARIDRANKPLEAFTKWEEEIEITAEKSI
jgi:flavodoxin